MRSTYLLIACVLLFSFNLYAQTALVPLGSSWKYLDNGSDQGSAWRTSSFNDDSWRSGNAKFGYGIDDAVTVISFGSSPSKKYITTYFRKSFNITDAADYISYTAQVMRDDGVVVYVNGIEVYRNNLPSGTISSSTLATDAKDNGTILYSFTISPSIFKSGTNVIAVEIHQSKANSPDLAFDLELTGETNSPPINQPPTVNLVSPSNNSVYDLGQLIDISATASDPDGSVSKIEFFSNNDRIGEDAINPYSLSWAPAATGPYSITARATDDSGATATSATVIVNVQEPAPPNQTAPEVLSINRQSPSTSSTDATTLTFRVTFSEPVIGVDEEDFILTTLTGSVSGVLEADAVVAVGSEGTIYDVIITSVSGNGTLRLNLKSDNTGIADTAGNFIQGGFSSGQSYTIEQEPSDEMPPSVFSINRHTPTSETTSATSVTFRATFSEPVTGVDFTDFIATAVSGSVNGLLTNNSVASVGTEGATYDITVSSISGYGMLRLDLKATDTGITDAAGHTISAGYTGGQIYSIQQNIPQTGGFASVMHLEPVPVSTNTGEKPQSKVWTYDGKHWAVLPNASGTHLWRLDGKKWTNVLRLSTRTTSKADCKMVDNVAHIFLYQGASSQMVSVEYIPTDGTYKLWSKRTSTVGITLDNGVETATIDLDSRGRMWLASAGVSDINVRWSDYPYNTWSLPIAIASGVTDDDICAVIALPGKIGVLWSNQNTKRYGFKTHTDGALPTTWSADEVPASQSALDVGNGMADDHLNMAVANDGTLYCAVKTEYNKEPYPQIALLVRRPTGIWDTLYDVAPIGTRPIVVLNESVGRIRVMYTSVDGGGSILYRESSVSTIKFGPQMTLISGTSYNNTTSTKQNFIENIVILASSSTQAVGVLATDGALQSIPEAPVLLLPANASVGVEVAPELSWSSSSGAGSYQVQLSSESDFSNIQFDISTAETSVIVANLSYNQNYYWRVKGINSNGSSNWGSTWSFYTVSSSPSSPLVGHWKMDEGSGSELIDASDYKNKGTTVGSPLWVAGVDYQALKLNGTSQYATVQDNASLDITGSMTLAAWIRPEKAATQYVLKKATQHAVDGYELSLASTGKVFFRFNQATAGDTYRLNSSNSYLIDGATWIHIAATYDGTVMRIYINGEENSSKSLSSPPPIKANDLMFAIGAQSDGATKFQGAIDDARIYNTALSASQIQELASAPSFSSSSTSLLAAKPDIKPQVDLQVYPNPFEAKATIQFTLAKEGDYDIKLYDSKGMFIAELKQGKSAAGIQNQVEVDGTRLSTGLYIAKLRTNHSIKTVKLLLNK